MQLPAGETLRTPALRISTDTVLLLAFEASHGARIEIHWIPTRGTVKHLWSIHANGADVRWSLHDLAGETGCLELAATGDAASVTIAKLQIGEQGELGSVNALDGYECRMRNELQHFDASSYRHAMYGDGPKPADARDAKVDEIEDQRISDETAAVAALAHRASAHLAHLTPNKGEATFNFAMRALQSLLPATPPNFLQRADTIARDGKLRMLSICSGAARVEQAMLEQSKRPIRLTLLDASPDLVQRAARELSSGLPSVSAAHTVDWAVADVNAGLPGDERYDVIVCVSALHHIANLEGVLGEIARRLTTNGEFWSIGEQIGRNGNRLWPRDQRAADTAFARLPERLRKNRVTGKVDARLETRDFSTGCFEGIRSEELEHMLTSYFVPLDVYRRNAFLWRCIDPTYADNYDLTRPDDLECLRQLIAAEAAHWAAGGTSTELHGVYGKKDLAV